jgi:WD40 repeat protein
MHLVAVSDSAHSILVIDDRTGRKVKTLNAESGSRSIAIDAEGKVLAGVGEDGMVRLWDLSSGRLRWEHDNILNTSGITFDTSGTRLGAWQTSWPGRVVIWDVASGRASLDTKMSFRKQSPGLSYISEIDPEAAKFSPDGKFLLIAVDNVSALDLDTGNILFDLEAKDVRQIGFNHAGTLVATAEFNGTVRLWDVKTGHERFSFSGHHFPLSSLSFSQDDRLLLATSVDGSARILDSVSGREISQLWGHRNGILTGTFNPQGDRVVTASMDGTARIWDTKTGENVGYIANSNSAMLFCSYTENADRIITVSADGTVAIHAAGIKELLELAEKELTNVMTVRPSGHNLVR